MIDPLELIIAALFGAIIGSFLNVCVGRWPLKQSVVRPRSRCPRCEAPIAWHDNIPIASWIALRGRCRHCGQPISFRYPAVELAVALLWLASAALFGFTFTALRIAVFATVLLGIALTDALHYVIPDGFTVFGLVFNLGASIAALVMGDASVFAAPYDALIGACVGAGAIAIVGWLGEVILRREAMGFGDVTLMAMAGAALGPALSLVTIFTGAALGAAVFVVAVLPIGWWRARRRGEAFTTPLVPFGVFLAPAALITLLWGQQWLAWYQGLLTGAA